jgi:hypothetical protein
VSCPWQFSPPTSYLGYPVCEDTISALEVAFKVQILGFAVSHAEPGFHATATDNVDQRNLLGELECLVQWEERDGATNSNPLGSSGDRRSDSPTLWQVPVIEKVMLSEPHYIGT